MAAMDQGYFLLFCFVIVLIFSDEKELDQVSMDFETVENE